MYKNEDIDDGSLFSKPHKVWCCPCYIACNTFFHPCRNAVSGNKRRYIKDGYDLDLAYVTPRIIVHGFPASGLEHFYRNPRYEIRRFMDERHGDHYKMYNFCCEPGRGYDASIFHGRVERYPFKDHNTPPLNTMVVFANSAYEWLERDPQNVVNMHCKAGKGRAGLMCCITLVRTGFAQSALAAMDHYDENRVKNRKGLTVTSQRKFVIFYEMLWRQCWGVIGNIGDITAAEAERLCVIPEQPALRLVHVEVLNLPANLADSFQITVHKLTNFFPEKQFDSGKHALEKSIATDCDVTIQGNFKIFISFKKGFLGGYARLVELQHNTYFMPNSSEFCDFGVDQLDIKKKMKSKLGTNIVLRLRFDFSSGGAVVVPGSTGYSELSTKEEDGTASIQMVKLISSPSPRVASEVSATGTDDSAAALLSSSTTVIKKPEEDKVAML